jgi:hypothetical protein
LVTKLWFNNCGWKKTVLCLVKTVVQKKISCILLIWFVFYIWLELNIWLELIKMTCIVTGCVWMDRGEEKLVLALVVRASLVVREKTAWRKLVDQHNTAFQWIFWVFFFTVGKSLLQIDEGLRENSWEAIGNRRWWERAETHEKQKIIAFHFLYLKRSF